ncbi:CIC11C00000002377 [Sungouiella intermedia]|uniref:CIC11C00000002377 n=1 Tax=Sungouiella intermedia TaxID=45354 RepID=A0A1L0B7I6_9ASCO|nr:CIC11C00000002377 [[Candida] intermedia]
MSGLFLLCLHLLAVVVIADTGGCVPDSLTGNGFKVNFYRYGLNDPVGWTKGFFETGYKANGIFASLPIVSDINFLFDAVFNKVVSGTIYGVPLSISNYTIELSGFFLPQVSGDYTFYLNADNGASLQFGAGTSCCNDPLGSITGDFSIDTLGPAGGGGNVDANSNTATFSLVAGTYYPIKIVTFNWLGNGGLKLYYIDPNNNQVSTFSNVVYQATFSDGACFTTVTTTWGNVFSSTTTITNHQMNTVLVGVPSSTTTLTTTWSGSRTSTTTVGGSDGTRTVIVEVPSSTTTLTTTWSGSRTSTTTVGGSDGTRTVIVEVPSSITTLTTTWSGSRTSTTTVGGSDGTRTVIVEVPSSTFSTTTTWSGNYLTTITIPGTDGTQTVIVEVPSSTTTFQLTWDQDYTSTVTIPGADGTQTVIVEVPSSTTTFQLTWDQDYTSTVTIPGADGTQTVIVEVPSSTTTFQLTWDQDYTSTVTIPGADGTQTVIVEVPSSTTTFQLTWDQDYTSTVTIPGADGTQTVIVEVPSSTTTFQLTWDQDYTSTVTIPGADGTQTVIIEVPRSTFTETLTWSETYEFTTTMPGPGGRVDLIIYVTIPTPYSSEQSLREELLTFDAPDETSSLFSDPVPTPEKVSSAISESSGFELSLSAETSSTATLETSSTLIDESLSSSSRESSASPSFSASSSGIVETSSEAYGSSHLELSHSSKQELAFSSAAPLHSVDGDYSINSQTSFTAETNDALSSSVNGDSSSSSELFFSATASQNFSATGNIASSISEDSSVDSYGSSTSEEELITSSDLPSSSANEELDVIFNHSSELSSGVLSSSVVKSFSASSDVSELSVLSVSKTAIFVAPTTLSSAAIQESFESYVTSSEENSDPGAPHSDYLFESESHFSQSFASSDSIDFTTHEVSLVSGYVSDAKPLSEAISAVEVDSSSLISGPYETERSFTSESVLWTSSALIQTDPDLGTAVSSILSTSTDEINWSTDSSFQDLSISDNLSTASSVESPSSKDETFSSSVLRELETSITASSSASLSAELTSSGLGHLASVSLNLSELVSVEKKSSLHISFVTSDLSASDFTSIVTSDSETSDHFSRGYHAPSSSVSVSTASDEEVTDTILPRTLMGPSTVVSNYPGWQLTSEALPDSTSGISSDTISDTEISTSSYTMVTEASISHSSVDNYLISGSFTSSSSISNSVSSASDSAISESFISESSFQGSFVSDSTFLESRPSLPSISLPSDSSISGFSESGSEVSVASTSDTSVSDSLVSESLVCTLSGFPQSDSLVYSSDLDSSFIGGTVSKETGYLPSHDLDLDSFLSAYSVSIEETESISIYYPHSVDGPYYVVSEYSGWPIVSLTSILTDLATDDAPNPTLSDPLSDPTLSDPALSDPALSDPTLSDPALSDPTLSDPALSDPTLTDPTLSDPTLSDPALSDPALSDPTLSDPALSDPTLSDPTLSDPALSDPTLSDPTLSDPALSDPTLSDPALSDPALSDPTLSDPTLSDPALSDPTLSDPALSDPTLSDPTLSDPTLSDPALSDPTLSDPALSDPTLSDPTLSDSALSDPTLSDPALSDPTLTDPTLSDSFLPDSSVLVSPAETKSTSIYYPHSVDGPYYVVSEYSGWPIVSLTSILTDLATGDALNPTLSDPSLTDPSLTDPTLSDPTLSDSSLPDSSVLDTSASNLLVPGSSSPAYSDPSEPTTSSVYGSQVSGSKTSVQIDSDIAGYSSFDFVSSSRMPDYSVSSVKTESTSIYYPHSVDGPYSVVSEYSGWPITSSTSNSASDTSQLTSSLSYIASFSKSSIENQLGDLSTVDLSIPTAFHLSQLTLDVYNRGGWNISYSLPRLSQFDTYDSTASVVSNTEIRQTALIGEDSVSSDPLNAASTTNGNSIPTGVNLDADRSSLGELTSSFSESANEHCSSVESGSLSESSSFPSATDGIDSRASNIVVADTSTDLSFSLSKFTGVDITHVIESLNISGTGVPNSLEDSIYHSTASVSGNTLAVSASTKSGSGESTEVDRSSATIIAPLNLASTVSTLLVHSDGGDNSGANTEIGHNVSGDHNKTLTSDSKLPSATKTERTHASSLSFDIAISASSDTHLLLSLSGSIRLSDTDYSEETAYASDVTIATEALQNGTTSTPSVGEASDTNKADAGNSSKSNRTKTITIPKSRLLSDVDFSSPTNNAQNSQEFGVTTQSVHDGPSQTVNSGSQANSGNPVVEVASSGASVVSPNIVFYVLIMLFVSLPWLIL